MKLLGVDQEDPVPCSSAWRANDGYWPTGVARTG
jgi:hypothetical protein